MFDSLSYCYYRLVALVHLFLFFFFFFLFVLFCFAHFSRMFHWLDSPSPLITVRVQPPFTLQATNRRHSSIYYPSSHCTCIGHPKNACGNQVSIKACKTASHQLEILAPCPFNESFIQKLEAIAGFLLCRR